MRRRTATAAVLTAVLVTALTATSTTPAGAAAPGRVHVKLRAAIKHLPVAKENGRGYDRDGFRHWVDADGDCQDTRDEVLAAESKTAVNGCDVTTGRWFSYYDRETWTRSSDVDIDHLVPLKEAWDSGARAWDADTRERYANDLGDPRTLVAVTDNVNQSKSDRDPAEWLPTYGVCRYVVQWTAVKTRWRLTVDRTEKSTLRRLAADCPNSWLTVRRAKVGKGGTSQTPGGDGGLDPRFDYCYQAIAAGYGPYHRGRDPEHWWYTDADGDGVVCE